MCTGDVDRKVWMRGLRAWRTASPARSMSFCPARARPATVAFLMRLAISDTASKSPVDAIGKPASMMSTPISSSRSATSSFSSSVMEAPGDCSPSRKVVSKIRTRSLGDALVAVMGLSFVSCAPLWGAVGGRSAVDPLSAQAHAPGRPSGAAKKQKESGQRGGGRHRQQTGSAREGLRRCLLQGGKSGHGVNLPSGRNGPMRSFPDCMAKLLAERWGTLQGVAAIRPSIDPTPLTGGRLGRHCG